MSELRLSDYINQPISSGNKTGCSPCGPGYYKSDEETENCKECDNGKTTNYYGQTSCDVVIEAGAYCNKKYSFKHSELNSPL